MGAVLSLLQNTWRVLISTISVLKALSTEFNQALKRASQPPGLPSPKPSQPYWLNDPPYPELVNVSSPELPQTADVAIIGSGIAGAAVAQSLLHERRRRNICTNEKVIVFDARQLCSGATARNGGHIKPSIYESFSRFSKLFPKDRAAALARFQSLHINCLIELCQSQGINAAEARRVETVDFFLDEQSFAKAVADIDQLKSLSVETNTPVESISVTKDAPDGFPYALQTTRGTVFVRHVVHATNAFASQLVPGLRSKIVGAQAHMSAQKPGQNFAYADGMHSWSVVYGEGFDYVTQRPPATGDSKGDLMIGGGFLRSLKQGIDQVGRYDDGSPLDPLTTTHIAGIFPAIFHPNWGVDAELKQTWSGIIGLTGDSLPLVGRLDTKLTGRDTRQRKRTSSDKDQCGEWITAGFSGEGMVWAWLSGAALGIMIAGSEDDELPQVPGRPGGKLAEWFPKELMVSHERIRSADVSNLAS
ncbi:unnamed protein product [Alternaria alternata]